MRVPKRYQKATINKEIKFDTKKSWYLFGEPGTGKTYYVWAFYLKWSATEKKKEKQIFDESQTHYIYELPLIVNWAVQCAEFRSTNYQRRDELISEMIKSKWLIIDDVGSEIKTDFSDDILFRVLNERYEEMKYTSFTSNINLGSLHYDGRIISRIAGIVNNNKFEIKGNDKRIKK